MSHAEQLIEIATELAMDVKGEAATLQRRLAELENRKLEMEARLDAAKFALQRLSSFVSVRGNDLQCPRCWILNEAPANLQPIDGGTKDQAFAKASSVCELDLHPRRQAVVSYQILRSSR
jgi:hypothetical protein